MISIVIPTYNGARWFKDTLPLIRAQDMPAELVAVDSGSTDETLDLLREYDARIHEIPNHEFSHGYARNLGVGLASGPLILFMSQDVVPIGTDWLSRMAALMEDPRVGAAHVRQLPRPDATPLERFFNNELYPAGNRRFELQPGERVTLDKIFFSNVCSITRRELCLRFPFPEDIIMSEDQVFAKALLQNGYVTLYQGDIEVVHSHHYDLGTLFRRNFDSAYSLQGVTEESASGVASAGLRYIRREVAFLARERAWGWLAYLPLYEAARISGRLFGAQANRLPVRLRKFMSLHRNYWTATERRQAASSQES